MNRNPGVSETLALLDALKGAVEDFAVREERLNLDFQTRSGKELAIFDSANADHQSKLTERLAALDEAFEQAKRECQGRFERRKFRINRAHSVVSQRVLDEVGGQEGDLKQRIREGSTNAERTRDVELANATAFFESLEKKLEESGESIARLERSARWAFRGYGKFRRLLRRRPKSEPDLLPDLNLCLRRFDGWKPKRGRI